MMLIDMFMSVLFILKIFVFSGCFFFTLLEHNILYYVQIRKGTNKVSYLSILQPFSDAIKLFTKENVLPDVSNFIHYYFSHVFNLFLSLIIWIIVLYFMNLFNYSLGVMYFFVLCSMKCL